MLSNLYLIILFHIKPIHYKLQFYHLENILPYLDGHFNLF